MLPTVSYDFTGQTAVITGGTGILGGEIACALVNCGAQVALLDLNLEPGKALLERMGPHAGDAALFCCNVLDKESITNAAAQVLSRFGKIDSLLNAAGETNRRPPPAPI